MVSRVPIAFCASIFEIYAKAEPALNEYYSGFQHIGHNDWITLIWVYIIPK